jgi:Rrf2 family protein
VKLLTRDTDYALRAIRAINIANKEIITVDDLVEETKIPRPFLRKILQILTKKGILRSYKGLSGGFKLGEKAKELYLTDIMELFQGAFKLNECLFKKKPCPNIGTCALRKKIDKIEKSVIAQIRSISLATLLDR